MLRGPAILGRALGWLGLPASAISTLAVMACLAAGIALVAGRYLVAALVATNGAVLWWLGQHLKQIAPASEPQFSALEPPERTWFGQRSIVRNAISSGIATGSDFMLMTSFVALLGTSAPVATFVGCAAGGLINFTINKYWAFGSDAHLSKMAPRYVFVSASSALLNSGLVAAVLLIPSVRYQLAWVAARIVVFVAWNYPLNRDYVFT